MKILFRICNENRCHEKPRIMGWVKCREFGLTHGICEECMVEVRKELKARREALANGEQFQVVPEAPAQNGQPACGATNSRAGMP